MKRRSLKYVTWSPTSADDVLVQVLAGPETTGEPAPERNCKVGAFCTTTAGW